jgi:hypothetical protein
VVAWQNRDAASLGRQAGVVSAPAAFSWCRTHECGTWLVIGTAHLSPKRERGRTASSQRPSLALRIAVLWSANWCCQAGALTGFAAHGPGLAAWRI